MLGYLFEGSRRRLGRTTTFPSPDRRIRLLLCALSRRTWPLLTGGGRRAVEAAERYADGGPRPTTEEWADFHAAEGELVRRTDDRGRTSAAFAASRMAAAAMEIDMPAMAMEWAERRRGLVPAAAQAALVRDVLGDGPLSSPVDLDALRCGRCGLTRLYVRGDGAGVWCDACYPDETLYRPRDRWLTPTVLDLARAAYEDRPEPGCPDCSGNGWVTDRYGLEQTEYERECARCGTAGHTGDGSLDPDHLAVLSDALEEAGLPSDAPCPECRGAGLVDLGLADAICPTCTSHGAVHAQDAFGMAYVRGTGRVPEPILAHLRSPGPHARGCWALEPFVHHLYQTTQDRR